MSYIKNLFTKQALLTGVLVMAIVVLFGYSSYAMFMRVDRYDPIQAMSFGDLGVSFAVAPASGIPNHISLVNAEPIDDESAISTSYDGNKFAFALTNYGQEASDYTVYLTDLLESDLIDTTSKIDLSKKIDPKYIKVQIDGGDIVRYSDLEDGLLCSGEVIFGEENIIYHDLRVWISDDYTGDVRDINLKLVFESVLQSENIKNNSIANRLILDNGGDTISNKTYVLDSNASENGLFYNSATKEYFFRGDVNNNNIVLKDEMSSTINFKVVSFSYDKVKIVLNNSEIIKKLKCTYNDLNNTLSNWYDNFYIDSYKKVIVSDNDKMYTTLTYSDLNYAGIAPNLSNSDFYLDTSINYWVINNLNTFIYSRSRGLVEAPDNASVYVLPVINISGKLAYSKGNGTSDNPYEFTINVN